MFPHLASFPLLFQLLIDHLKPNIIDTPPQSLTLPITPETSWAPKMSNPPRVNATIPITLIFGTVANPIKELKSVQADAPTHQWTVYVRSATNNCISPWVSSVVFNIHETFAEPRRVIREPPFCVQEVGWGEFTIHVEVHLHPSCGVEPPITMQVPLKLFVKPTELTGVKVTDKVHKKPVFNEIVEEILIVNPTVEFEKLLKVQKQQQKITQFDLCCWSFLSHEYAAYERETLRKISDVRTFTRLQTQNLLHQMYILRAQTQVLDAYDKLANQSSSSQNQTQQVQQQQQQQQQQPQQPQQQQQQWQAGQPRPS